MNKPLEVLKKYWGYPSFRFQQEDIIHSVIGNNDVVALLHTGAGKSLCYQVPAMCMPGKTVVISPLIALMQDQVKSLNKRGIPAKAIYSSLGYRQVDLILDNFVHGPLKILYIAPERISTDIFLERFKLANVSLIAVDEAHCISQWGQDFRPAYQHIHMLRSIKAHVPIIGVTATATPKVLDDIVESLEMERPKVFRSSFARPNISFTVMMSETKEMGLFNMLKKVKGSGIIYARSRKMVKKISLLLNEHGFKTGFYHGGLPIDKRTKTQEDWLNNKTPIIVSTNAFGMGVDKPDVRFVIHYDLPPSIEEYYQEAGRAGRDGNKSWAVMIINHGDITKLQLQQQNSYPDIEYLESIYQKLCSYLKVGYGSGRDEYRTFSMEAFSETYGLNPVKVFSALSTYEKEGWIYVDEAVKKPPKVLITSNKNEITLSTRNKAFKGQLLILMLRQYEGLFIEYVTIDLGKLANELKSSVSDVDRELKIMARESIIDYKPPTTIPEIYFLRDRPAPGSFAMDRASYRQRSRLSRDRMNAMIHYALDKQCRQQSILEYFGEESPPCGTCDVCLKTFDTSFDSNEKDRLLKHVSLMAKEKPLTLYQYLQRFPYEKRNKATAIIYELEKEGAIILNDNEEISILQ